MKNFIRKIILFIAIAFPIYIIVVGFWGKNLGYYKIGSYGYMYSRIKDIQNHKNPDILFLGSSHSYRSFDTRIFQEHGIKSFNLGSSAQSPKQTEVLLKQYLDIINPKVIVYEICPGELATKGIESTTDLISNDHIDIDICRLAIKSGDVRVFNTLIYALFQEYVFHIRDCFHEDTINYGDHYISGGFVEKLDYQPFVNSDNHSQKVSHIRSDQLKAFGYCIQMINNKNIPFLLIKAPLPKSSYESISNHAEINDIISSFGHYIDFNLFLHLDDTCFFDSDHLAQPGVLAFDEYLIQVLDTIALSQ